MISSFKIHSIEVVEELITQLQNIQQKSNPNNFIKKSLPHLLMNYVEELFNEKEITLRQRETFKNTISKLNDNNLERMMIEKNNENTKLIISENENLYQSSDIDSLYYLSYLNADEIFDKYIAGKTVGDAINFFSKMCDVHLVSDFNKQQALKLFEFSLSVCHYNTVSLNLGTLRSELIFTKSLENFYEYIYHTGRQGKEVFDKKTIMIAYDYFYDYLGINEVHLDENYDLIAINDLKDLSHFIDNHEIISKIIIDCFTLTEELKNLLIEENKIIIQPQIIEKDNIKVFNIVNNILFNSKITEEKKSKAIDFISKSSHNLTVLKNENSIYHSIVQGLVSKNETELFNGIEQYITDYLILEEIEEGINQLSLNSKLALFFSDHFKKKFYLDDDAFSLFHLMINNYDKNLLNYFIKKYDIPKNLAVKLHIDNKDYMVSLIELCLYHNNFSAAKELIELGFVIEPFKTKLIYNDMVETYHYTPFSNLFVLNDTQICFLIENSLINKSLKISYLEELETNNDKTIKEVVYSIFYFLLYYKYENAFILLYNKNAHSNFKLLSFNEETTVDLLVYYLTSIRNFSSYDTNILDIFSKEHFYYKKSNILEFQKIMKMYDENTAIEIISYLQNIFDNDLVIDYQASEKNLIINDNKNLIVWFDKEKLEKHFKKIEKDKDSVNKEFVKSMLSNNSHLKPNLVINDESFFNNLSNEFPNFEEVVQYYKSQFRLKKLSGKVRINPILLLGEPGIGKTYFAQKLSQYLNTGYSFIDMASLTANWILTGNNGTWKGAKQGKILEAMINSNTINPIILMDEIEKAKTGEYDPTLALYQLLEEINAKSFTDEFIDFSFDASGIIYIACANTLGNLSEPLQTRFKIFNIPSPNSEQLDVIIQNIYREASKDAFIFNSSLDIEIVTLLKSYSLRAIKVMIDEAIGNALLELPLQDIEQCSNLRNKISLTLQHFKFSSKKRPMGF